ncbi:GmrSD restriction endonuclease domain-containing protein [Georgenia sp. MJ170]|uniref:GmrSD restriction endonuclease domain-containing protein n=1 Tax=Georgenia sunbinii TaxID=3117728 RepID=UPI002F265B44
MSSSSRRWRTIVSTVAALIVLGVLVDGLTGVLMVLGLAAAVVGLAALVTGRRPLNVPGRGGGAVALVVAAVLVASGAATMPASPPADAASDAPTAEAATEPAGEPTVTESTSPAVDERAGSALAAAQDLVVKGRAPKTGYDRDLFAYRSYDQDRNGCDVRNDVLRRDLVDLVVEPGTNGCVVTVGLLHDPYSGAEISFRRGADTSSDVQIDHVVALSDAWQKGAQSWDGATMREFGNDPLNLLAVDGPLNSQKGDGDTATWLPPNTSFRCEYAARQVAVKHEYSLWVTDAEQRAMVSVLEECPDQPLPVRETAALMPELAGTTPAPAPTSAPPASPAPVQGGSTDPQFRTCKDAKAAGFGPYVSGADPEYDWYRDGDSDGTVCE